MKCFQQKDNFNKNISRKFNFLLNTKQMKKYHLIEFFYTIVLIFLLSYTSNAQNNISNEVSNAIKNGNAKDLAKNFYSSIDLTVPGNEGTYSKSQAELIIKDFFTKNPPKSFIVNHQGTSADGSQYSIGTFNSSTLSFRTYYIIKKFSDTYYIQLIQFEQQ